MFPRFGLGRQSLRPLWRPSHLLQASLRPTRRFQHSHPGSEDFLSPGQKSAQSIMKGFIAANTVVWLAWTYATTLSKEDSPDTATTKEKMRHELHDKFVFRANDIAQGKYYSAILSQFSHVNFFHFTLNMMGLWSLGNGLILYLPHMTGAKFLTLCLGSALGSSLATYTHKKQQGIPNGSLGASGVISGIFAAVVMRAPFAKIGLMFLPIEFSAWMVTSALFGYSAYTIATYDPRNPPLLDHAGHIGGAVFGLLYYTFALRRGRIPRTWRR